MIDTTSAVEKLGNGLLHALHRPTNKDELAAKTPVGSFISPYSCMLALTLALEGAQPASTTARQLVGLLSGSVDALPNDVTAEVAQMLKLVQAASTPTNGLTVVVANSVWAKPTWPLHADYVSRVAQLLGATAQPLTSADVVNAWCSEHTNGKIAHIVDEHTVQSMDAMLINALYFKGLWAHQFHSGSTQRARFTTSIGEDMDVVMMSKKFDARQVEWAITDQYAAVRLPYKGNTFAAVVMMPTAVSNIRALLHAGVTSGRGVSWSPRDVFVFLPRFKLECKFSLRGPLAALGVPALFTGSQDLSLVMDSPLPVQVDDVLQKVFIEVNEEGTEAAAVTAVMMRCCAAPIPTPEVRFDRPFLFSVVHVETNLVLFTGVVEKPETWADVPPQTQGPPPGYPQV